MRGAAVIRIASILLFAHSAFPCVEGTARADEASNANASPSATVERTAPERRHADPRLKLSYRGFSISNLDGTPLWLSGGQLDLYPISRRYLRLGVELEGGGGKLAMSGIAANLAYGMVGAEAGFQYPARVTPFVEGRFAGGALYGSLSGPVTVSTSPSVTLNGGSVATWMYLGGIDAGIELYAFGRFYLSAAIGWARPTWHGVDYAAMKSDPMRGIQYKDFSSDTFTFKVGVGI